MKKIILLLTLFFSLIGASAQNANRAGFFMELAYGYASGLPYYQIHCDPNQMEIKPLSGSALNVALGPRIKLSRHFALDIRVEAQSFIYKKMEDVSLGPVISARYTSPEIFNNVSLYASVGAGYYYTFLLGGINDYFDADLSSESGTYYYCSDDPVARMPIIVNFGMNFTTHFYGGVVYDMRVVFDPTTRIANILGVQLGYRF